MFTIEKVLASDCPSPVQAPYQQQSAATSSKEGFHQAFLFLVTR
jgi:hypothetical protein